MNQVRGTTRPWLVIAQVAAALAAAMGVGRFAYTPILPLMLAGTDLTPSGGAALATANYLGYLVGALIGIAAPRLVGARWVLRACLVTTVIALAAMPLTESSVLWSSLRFVAGVASALVFMSAVSALFAALSGRAAHLTGWGFGGVGAGIALSGSVVLAVGRVSTWQAAWWSAAALALVLTVVAWNLTHATAPAPAKAAPAQTAPDEPAPGRPTSLRRFTALTLSYSLEGVGYIIAGTFLVAAIDENASHTVGALAWVIVGLAVVPSAALWAALSRRAGLGTLLTAALLIQAVGVALPAVFTGVGPALVSAVLFGATFIGISSLSLGIGNRLGVARSVAILTTGYSLGQILGPLVVAPLLADGYRIALAVAGITVLVAALAAASLRGRRIG